ncbi:MAG: haloacid dehalogenase type II, partial [Pricia sp.]
DLTPLKTKVVEAMGNEHTFDLWFSQLLHYSLVETVTENYSDFSSIAAAVFDMVAQKFNKTVAEEKKHSILSTIKELPPHSDVLPALERLKNNRFKIVALTNGNQEVVEKQLAHANIDHFFNRIFSVEQVARYKPHRSTYESVLEIMKVPAKETLMVAAHAWDLIGAKRAGMQTAFVIREGKSMYPLSEQPDLTGKTILEIAEKIGFKTL